MALNPPVEVPQGAIRLNTDSQKLEFFAQDQWWEMATNVPTLNGGVRAIWNLGEVASGASEYITISTQGNAVAFGNVSDTTYESGAVSSRTRMVMALGYTNPSYTNILEYFTFSQTGNAIDFGDLNNSGGSNPCGAVSNETRGVFAVGRINPANTNTMDYITIASTGNANDFGDSIFTGCYEYACGSPTRGVFCGGRESPSTAVNTIQFVTIASTGNAMDFGDLPYTSEFPTGVLSNATRGLYAGGSPGYINNISYFQIQTQGNALDFGDLTVGRRCGGGGVSSATRGVFAGGLQSGGSNNNTCDYVEIATQGNACDFGDTVAAGGTSGWSASNGHGGL